MDSLQQKVQHLHWRAGFGPSTDISGARSVKDEVNLLFSNSKNHVPLVNEGWMPLAVRDYRNLDAASKTEYRQQEKEGRLKLNQEILTRYTSAKGILREKMTFFWMDHFACRIANPVFVVNYYNTINAGALGKFSDLLHAMVRNPALLQYLTNNLNRKLSPNENFARELMELFSLGIGNYTETDVKEGARAMTGWGFNRDGKFIIRDEHHDNGIKNFLGEKGNFDGDAIVDIILKKKRCAEFITTKLYRFFVNETVDEKIIATLSEEFYNSGYNIGALMFTMFTSDWFYLPRNIGSRIKSPVELMAGMTKIFRVKFENGLMSIQLQKIMGQMLFDPPNVAGWPSGTAWIDSSRLLYRMKLPELILQEAESILQPKDEFDNLETVRVDKQATKDKKIIQTTFDASGFQKEFSSVPAEKLTQAIMNFLLQNQPDAEAIKLINNLTTGTDGNTKVFKTAIYVMSLPEYQLC